MLSMFDRFACMILWTLSSNFYVPRKRFIRFSLGRQVGAVLEPNTYIGGKTLCNDMKWRDQMNKNAGILRSVVLIVVHIPGNFPILVISLHMAHGEIFFSKDDLLDNVLIY